MAIYWHIDEGGKMNARKVGRAKVFRISARGSQRRHSRAGDRSIGLDKPLERRGASIPAVLPCPIQADGAQLDTELLVL